MLPLGGDRCPHACPLNSSRVCSWSHQWFCTCLCTKIREVVLEPALKVVEKADVQAPACVNSDRCIFANPKEVQLGSRWSAQAGFSSTGAGFSFSIQKFPEMKSVKPRVRSGCVFTVPVSGGRSRAATSLPGAVGPVVVVLINDCIDYPMYG